ncbi:PrpF domain-containing protein [Methylobacterium mesophilicum]|uniref:PrpF domain-containing protein n=1 Tax=Methylobacterium mesophilicum TaxID=39956 RepID=UPI001FCE3809|nr:PrpF domain-containing protein [Methylobacterium mesophilicum]
MTQCSLPAVFMRGGTSKALMLHARDLPADREAWTPLLCRAMGSPDSYGRQLDGMGGGVSSLSKVCVIAPAARPDFDVDYTFVQVAIHEARIDLAGNCGNMSSAVGPFAIDEGLVRPRPGDAATVRIFNTNTRKAIHATFPLIGGRAREKGELAIPGVAGTGAAIRLDFLDPGGATTGRLLPSGRTRDVLEVPGHGSIEASLVDAANATVFVRAADLGLTGRERPDEVDARPDLLIRLEAIRAAGSVAMGIAPDLAAAHAVRMVPFICFVSPPDDGEEGDLVIRAISNGQAHRALPLTVSLCTAAAAQIDGTVVAACRRAASPRDRCALRCPRASWPSTRR